MVALHWVVLAFVTPLLPILHSLHCIILPHCHSAYSTWPTVHYGLNCIALSSVGLCDPSPACRLPGFRLQSIVATNPVLTISPHYHHHLHHHCADCHHHNVAGLHIINSSCHLCSHFLCHYHCEWLKPIVTIFSFSSLFLSSTWREHYHPPPHHQQGGNGHQLVCFGQDYIEHDKATVTLASQYPTVAPTTTGYSGWYHSLVLRSNTPQPYHCGLWLLPQQCIQTKEQLTAVWAARRANEWLTFKPAGGRDPAVDKTVIVIHIIIKNTTYQCW